MPPTRARRLVQSIGSLPSAGCTAALSRACVETRSRVFWVAASYTARFRPARVMNVRPSGAQTTAPPRPPPRPPWFSVSIVTGCFCANADAASSASTANFRIYPQL